MSDLADQVLPLIRTRNELYRRGAANRHGVEMHEAVDILERQTPTTDAAEVYQVTHKALVSAITVIARADDSSGIIGHACRRLLALHPVAAARVEASPSSLVTWMIKFQFEGEVDYFELDPVAYSPALGAKGMSLYRSKLDAINADIGPLPPGENEWSAPNSRARWKLRWNDERLAVHDRDVDAIIRTHAKDRRVAAWLHNTAKALAEIDEIDLAIDWAKRAVDFDHGHQSRTAADYWCDLIARHHPEQLLDVRALTFRRWPSSVTAARLRDAAGTDWPDFRDEVDRTLAESPRDAVWFALDTLEYPERAWDLAHALGLRDTDLWERLITAYEKVDPLATLPVLKSLAESDLEATGAKYYKSAARRLTRMRRLAAGTDRAAEVDDLIADLREVNRRRPRLQQEFDRAHLP